MLDCVSRLSPFVLAAIRTVKGTAAWYHFNFENSSIRVLGIVSGSPALERLSFLFFLVIASARAGPAG